MRRLGALVALALTGCAAPIDVPQREASEPSPIVGEASTYGEAVAWCWWEYKPATEDYIDCVNAAAQAWYGVQIYWKA